MAKLTLAYIYKKIRANPKKFEQVVYLDEPGKALVYTLPQYTWKAADGNRTVEGFIIDENNGDNDPIDTVGYFNMQCKMITKVED